jgi:putative SOS response-associated peptidase YedK
VIVHREGNTIVPMRWGLLPRWAKDERTGQHTTNARAETLAEKPMFRGLLKNYRCLVPASGFYEWKKNGQRKVPYYFRPRESRYCAFAGLYDLWRDPQGLDHATYTIITTGANELVAPVHDRMPVILKKEDEERWLSGSLLAAADLHAILAPCPAGLMEAYPVEGRVNNVNVDEETLIRPLTTLT